MFHHKRTRPSSSAFRTGTFLKVQLFGALLMTLALSPANATQPAAPAKLAFHGKLDNGLEVVVVPDRRAPVVTHMVWYRVGGADEPQGKSGIAHFLEHLMFKGTDKIPPGEFSKIVARLGGQDNAFTAQDITSYFQRVAKEKLPQVMEMEADRMANLKLDEKEVTTERKVILEERRMRVDNDPASLLQEQMLAALYVAHPYHTPVIGWENEMRKLSRADALAFYKRFYAPNNATLIVTGDVEPQEVMALAKETYGKIPANADVGAPRVRPTEPEPIAERRIVLRDGRAGKATLERYYLDAKLHDRHQRRGRGPASSRPHPRRHRHEPCLQRARPRREDRLQHQLLVQRACPRHGPFRRLCARCRRRET